SDFCANVSIRSRELRAVGQGLACCANGRSVCGSDTAGVRTLPSHAGKLSARNLHRRSPINVEPKPGLLELSMDLELAEYLLLVVVVLLGVGARHWWKNHDSPSVRDEGGH